MIKLKTIYIFVFEANSLTVITKEANKEVEPIITNNNINRATNSITEDTSFNKIQESNTNSFINNHYITDNNRNNNTYLYYLISLPLLIFFLLLFKKFIRYVF